jgi:hypothetical protein
MKKILLALSLVIISLGGCYYRGYDDGNHKDRDRHEENKGHEDNKDDHRDQREQH